MRTPRVSVALCTRNGAAYLAAQLHSLAAQSHKPAELVVCDDASSDDTVRLVRRFAAEAPFPVRLFENPNPLGVSGNFSRALSLCQGDVLMPCDQDDVWHPDKIACQTDALGDGAQLVFSDLQLVDELGRPTGRTQWQALGFDAPLKQAFRDGQGWQVLLRFNVVTGTAMAFRADLRELVFPVATGFVHDEWIAFVAAVVGRVVPLDRALVQYRQHGQQQIGAARGNLWAQLAYARQHMGRGYFHSLVERAETLLAHLERHADRLQSPDILPVMRERLRHHQQRAALREGRHVRLPIVFKEWTRGRYQKFGYGWKSAAQDLLL